MNGVAVMAAFSRVGSLGPVRREVVRIDGLDDDVVILRDEWGIPHVRAATTHDAFFGQGFAQAADRLGQMEYDRRRAYGRWAAVAGPSAVAFDAFTRRVGLRDAARREYDALSSAGRAVLDAYAAGVNAYLGLGRDLPTDLRLAGIQPQPWAPWDCNAVFLVRHVVFANWQKKLWRARVWAALGREAAVRLEADDRPVPLIVPPGDTGPPLTLDPAWFAPVAMAVDALLGADPGVFGTVAVTGPGAESDRARDGASASRPGGVASGGEPGGSNAWAISGTRTASGMPLVAGDPHRQVESPGVYVQNHLACPEFDAVGLAFVGVPGLPHFGHNRAVAWCVTNAYGDYQDLYVERFPGGRSPDRVETIDVRDAAAVSVECFETPHGPVVFGDPATGAAIAMQSTALVAPSSGLEVLAPMLTATSIDGLCDVMRDWVDPVNNLVCADVDGAIGYHTVGRIPIRPAANAAGPVPGWTTDHDWHGTIPFDDLPATRDPTAGMIVTANQRIVGPEFPFHLSDGCSRPDRAERITALLLALGQASVDDMARIHGDVASLRAPLWIERSQDLTPGDEHEREALEAVAAWDGRLDADSTGAAVVMALRDATCRHLVDGPAFATLRGPARDEPPGAFVTPALRLWPALSALLAADDETFLAPGETWREVLQGALTTAVALLRARLGDDVAAWRWGALHKSAPRHPLSALHPEWADRLDPPAVEAAGEWDTVFAAAHAAGVSFAVTGASVARYVFDLADWDESRWIVPCGASGEPASAHFADQRDAWAAAALIPMRYDWAAIEANATVCVELAAG